MRSRQSTQRWCLGGAFLAIALLFWMLVVVSGWLVRDSYALDEFPKTHPILGFIVSMLWVVGDYGGVYVLALILGAAFWRLTIRRHQQKP